MTTTTVKKLYDPIYYRKYKLDYAPNIRCDKVTFNNDLLCMTYTTHNTHYLRVYRMMSYANVLSLVFTINMTKQYRNNFTDDVYVCTTNNPGIYVLYWRNTYMDKYNVFTITCSVVSVTFITPIDTNPNKPPMCEILSTITKEYPRKHGVSKYSAIGAMLYYYDYESGFGGYDTHVDWSMSVLNANDIVANNMEHQWRELLSETGCLNIIQVSPTRLCLQNIHPEQGDGVGTNITLYNINTCDNTYNSTVVKYKDYNYLEKNLLDYNGNHLDLIRTRNDDGEVYFSRIEYITHDAHGYVRHPVTILSVYTAPYIYKIDFMTYDIVYCEYLIKYMRNAVFYGVFYHFNRNKYTLTPIYFMSDDTCNIPPYNDFIILELRNIRNVMTLYKLARITDAECGAVYAILDEYLPREMCDIVWAYYVR